MPHIILSHLNWFTNREDHQLANDVSKLLSYFESTIQDDFALRVPIFEPPMTIHPNIIPIYFYPIIPKPRTVSLFHSASSIRQHPLSVIRFFAKLLSTILRYISDSYGKGAFARWLHPRISDFVLGCITCSVHKFICFRFVILVLYKCTQTLNPKYYLPLYHNYHLKII